MKLADVVLFLHILVVLCAFALASALHTAEILMRRAGTIAELRRLAKPGKLGPAFGVIVLLLFGLGSWLVHLDKSSDHFAYSDPFVWTAIVVLVFLFVTGPTILARHHKRLERALDAAPDGPVTAELRALALDPLAVMVGTISTGVALGVVFNMATKPNAAAAIAAILLAGATAAGLGYLICRPSNLDVATASKLAPANSGP